MAAVSFVWVKGFSLTRNLLSGTSRLFITSDSGRRLSGAQGDIQPSEILSISIAELAFWFAGEFPTGQSRSRASGPVEWSQVFMHSGCKGSRKEKLDVVTRPR